MTDNDYGGIVPDIDETFARLGPQSEATGTAPSHRGSGLMGDIKQYRKKPVEIIAWQWTEQSEAHAIAAWVGNFDCTYDEDVCGGTGPDGEDWGLLEIETPAGTLTVAPFDYVVRGIGDVFYPVPPGMFERTHSEVRK